MTTLVTLATKDAVVLGCDSLATSTRLLIDPYRLIKFFNHESDFKLRVDEDGQPLMKHVDDLMDCAMSVPYDHMTDVDKLVDLSPLPMGLAFTGITSIGDRTVKSLLAEFRQHHSPEPPGENYTVESISSAILEHLCAYYDKEYPVDEDEFNRPYLEYLVAGYDKVGPLPRMVRTTVGNKHQETLDGPGVAFAGMMQEIQRIVFGLDDLAIGGLYGRFGFLLEKFAERVRTLNGSKVEIPDIGELMGQGFHLFGKMDPDQPEGPDFRLPGFEANWGDFSDQNAIDCVAWFIGIMREAHRFSSKMPTVGGAIHIALVNREAGFQFISREEYRHEDHRVQRVRSRPGG